MEFAGKTALVTGAGSGIGRATALMFAERGANVVALSFGEEETTAVAAEIETRAAKGAKVLPIVADVASDAAMKAAYEQVADTFGTLDIAYANAGINGTWAPIEDMSVEEWDQTHHINLRGTFLTVKYAIPLMRMAGGGSIVITSSVTGTRIFSLAGATAYGATKMGQLSFTQSAARELARYKIRVNAVCPGATSTNIDQRTYRRDIDTIRTPVEYPEGNIPLTGERGTPEDIGEAVLFLCSDKSRYTTGTAITVDGGLRLIVG